MDDDIIRILISTDNHLGAFEKDSVRSNDCFAAFEEVLVTAKAQKADFVLLGGDMFHENKPSRRTMHNAISLLRKYCLGEDPVYIEVLNNQKEVFKCGEGSVNYDSPFLSISMPVFSIHGNHDDPSREGGPEPLAALDVLSACNLVNYIGKCEQVDDIEVVPVLIRKGTSMLALYSLGAIRDERLNRMWYQKKVKFVRPSVEQGRDSFFNIFVVHQNRDYGRGTKNCLHESMIPEWMDLVVWGNEHECQPNLVESLVGTFRIFQPGSSVATSLVEGESMSNPKHMGMVEIKGRFFRMHPIRYTQIRPFVYSDIALSSIPDLDANDPKIEEKIKSVLSARVRHLIEEGRAEAAAVVEAGKNFDFHVDKPDVVLVRLRVDHTGYPTINQQRFGTGFLDIVANPPSLLLFAKKKKESYGGVIDANVAADEAYRSIVGDDAEGLDDPMSRIRIEDLVKDTLEGNHRQLNVLIESDMAQAIDDFVVKKHLSAITDIVQETLEKTQEALFKNVTATGKDQIAEQTMKIRHREEAERLKQRKDVRSKPAADLSIFSGEGGAGSDTSDNDNTSVAIGRGGGRGKAAAAGGGAAGRGGRGRGRAGRGEARATTAASKKNAKKIADSEEEMSVEESADNFSEEDLSVTGKRGRGGSKITATAAPKGKRSGREVSAKATVAKPVSKAKAVPAKAASSRASSRVATAGGKRKYAVESDEDGDSMESIESNDYIDDNSDVEDSYQEIKPKAGARKPKTTATAKAQPSAGKATKRGRAAPAKGSPVLSSPDRGIRSRRVQGTGASTFSSMHEEIDLTEDW